MAVGAEHREAAPQRGHAVGQPPGRPVPGRHQHHLDLAQGACHTVAFPPVELHGVGDAAGGQPRLQAQRHHVQRRAAGLAVQGADAGRIEMVVVVVRHQHQVHPRQFAQRQPRGLMALRAGEGQGRGPLRKDGVGEQREAAQLGQHRGMADPGGGRQHALARPRVGLQEGVVRGHLRDRAAWGRWQPLAASVGAPAQHLGQALGREVVVVVLEAVGAMVRFSRVEVAVHAGREEGAGAA